MLAYRSRFSAVAVPVGFSLTQTSSRRAGKCGLCLRLVAGGEAEALEGGVVIAGVVYLEGGVGDPELVGQKLLEVAAAGVAVLVVGDEDVG